MKKQQQKHPFGPLAWKWLGIQYPKSTFILLKLQKYGSTKVIARKQFCLRTDDDRHII